MCQYVYMRRTAEEAAATRELILDTALGEFGESGYAGARLADIAQAAGITRGAIYHHFEGKEHLYRALVEERSAGINALAEGILEAGDDPLQTLRRLLVSLLSYGETDKNYRALLLMITKTSMGAAERSIMVQTKAGRRSFVEYLTGLYTKGVETGVFRPDLQAGAAALATVGFLNGLGLLWIQDPTWFSIKDQAEALTDVHIQGVAA
jgi:TetR/AcrR family transcriptional regulator, acrAB operon repressor